MSLKRVSLLHGVCIISRDQRWECPTARKPSNVWWTPSCQTYPAASPIYMICFYTVKTKVSPWIGWQGLQETGGHRLGLGSFEMSVRCVFPRVPGIQDWQEWFGPNAKESGSFKKIPRAYETKGTFSLPRSSQLLLLLPPKTQPLRIGQ